jgi:hypothetical protein
MPHYSDEQKSIAIGAVQRWGLRPAERWLKQEWPDGPSQQTLLNWTRAGVVVTTDANEFLSEVGQQRKEKWHAAIDSRREATFEAYDAAVEKRNWLGMQQASTAIGIQLDKLVPLTRPGAAVSVGAAGNVNIMVAGSPNPKGSSHRDVPDDWEEGDVIPGESQELVEGTE